MNFKLIYYLIAANVIATPIFVIDRINAETDKCVKKDTMVILQKNVDNITRQQQEDHDVLIEIRTIVKGKKNGTSS